MGHPTGYLDTQRQIASKQRIDQRLRHFQEIYNWLSEDAMKEQASRCMNCGTPFCHGAGCPLGNNVPEFNELVYKGRWKEACERLHLTNNFPEVTGRICPALCEASCVAGIDAGAVSVREIELTVIEKGWREGWIRPIEPQEETSKRVAVIGSGPTGLAAAQQLRRAGHQVMVFEKADRVGGILRYGIPDFKLEKWILDRRIAQMKAEGVVFEVGIEAGVDISAQYLQKKFDALVLAVGARVPRDLAIPGREAQGIYFAMDYLTQQNRRVAGEEIPEDEAIWLEGKRVVIIGGGDTGSDCLGTALRQKAAHVEQLELMPAPPEMRDDEGTPWPMWPYMMRTSSSHEEGGARHWSVQTTRFLVENGAVRGLEIQDVAWAKNPETGRMSMEPVAGTERTIDADAVVLAMGFTYAEPGGLVEGLGVELDARGNIKADPETLATSVPGVYAAGDAQTGAWLVVGGIAGGRMAARAVDIYLMGESALPAMPPRANLFIH